MTTYTPGPWKAMTLNYQFKVGHLGPSWLILGKDEFRSIVQVWGYNDEDEANAYLITAAPDLLASVEELLRVCYDLEANDETVRAVANARAAIAKATGREQ